MSKILQLGCFFLFLLTIVNGHAVRIITEDGASHLNSTSNSRQIALEDKCAPAKYCRPGLVVPVWEPQVNINFETKLFRAFIYLIAMFYLFLGVSIVSDRFMAAIEVITSQEREVKVKRPNGETTIVLITIWNETVSNLTLMALGSSAPEILLSVIEICGNGFEAGDLGPSTIVGSAAFNLYVIIAICIAAIPSGEIRRIERNDVFWVTLLWSLFAYIWLYLIVCVFSPNVIEVWEGLLTFSFFFLTVITAYIANRFSPAIQRKILGVNKRRFHHNAPRLQSRSKRESNAMRLTNGTETNGRILNNEDKSLLDATTIQAFYDHRQKFVDAFQELRHTHPDMSLHEIGRLVTQKTLADAPKSRAYRRIQAMRRMTAGRSLLATYDVIPPDIVHSVQDTDSIKSASNAELNARSMKVILCFQPSHYICSESIGVLKLFVKCERGRSIKGPTNVSVNYKTIAGTAKAGEDFEHTEGTLNFRPDVQMQEIKIKIVDNDVYEFDEEFFVHLFEPKAVSALNGAQVPVELGAESEALVIIVDDDHAGHFGFSSQVEKVRETDGFLNLAVKRQRGARGRVIIPYTVIDGRAKRNEDFKCDDGQLVFNDHQTTAHIRIEIINDDCYEKSEEFYVQLGEPIWETPTTKDVEKVSKNGEPIPDGRPFLNENSRCKVIIKENEDLKGFVDRLLLNANCSLAVGTTSWREQFREALTVDDNENGEDEPPSCLQLAFHYISLPWKLLFAFIPPTDYFQGWLCFIVAIVLIGVLTALIGDVAAMFGCTLGVKDSVTAISIVAMGTSLPDTFASKLAAVQDKTADASIGNVTGSNAVNVFLGIGVAWAVASIYHVYVKGDIFHVHAGSLETSLALFLIAAIFNSINSCPPGQPGPPGAVGPPGIPGQPGRDGFDGKDALSFQNSPFMGCTFCPRGLQGNPGDAGRPGIRGRRGASGIPGRPGKNGLAGMPGDMGAIGKRGLQGKPGRNGQHGETGIKVFRVKGHKGATGPIGDEGSPGNPGRDGLIGAIGPKGSIGMRGVRGIDGMPGQIGPLGPPGKAGNDALYCKCPAKSYRFRLQYL